ncbi:hypothetical protein OTB20_17090 [Streptomyces sp. H27-H1]|uniref:hypothetical protein n=1 Tax=Streptomyces sp. H27-H1 TaxID=2996461 RepID=UPI0022704741|nr:hypothetical protein [Streptomyces sp. H27-H1]MCY0927898.1 hypothetical protein [Streptomyces sp. H27-H1]
MSTPLPLNAWGEVPPGTHWPGPQTLVLFNRELRPGTDLARLSRFGEDRWDLNPGIFEEHANSDCVNFGLVPAPLRSAAKHYVWQLLNHPQPRSVRRAPGVRIAVTTVAGVFTGAMQFVFTWFTTQGVTTFSQVTPQMLDDYLDYLEDEEVSLHQRYAFLREIRRLWANRDLLPAEMRLPPAPPWDGEASQDLLGRSVKGRVNLTRRIGEQTMQLLLLWSIRFIEDFAEDIVAANVEYLDLRSRRPDSPLVADRLRQPGLRRRRGELRAQVSAHLEGLRERGESLPGIRDEDGTLQIRWSYLAMQLETRSAIQHTPVGEIVRESGLPISEGLVLSTPITGLLDSKPWRRQITFDESPALTRHLATAGFVVVSYLSGARMGEVLNLRRGCVHRDKDTGLWLMEGLYFKGAKDKDGNKIPEGMIRPDPWVVIEVVARAVAVMERLHDSPLLFPKHIKPYLMRAASWKRQGGARTSTPIGDDLAGFTAWVNTECQVLGRTDLIPDDGRGRLTASRFRRTLAWFIRRRPRGLVAATVQYGHAHTRMLEGYAGSYESGFPDEYAFEDWLFRLEGLAEDEKALAAGEHVSGPAADAYRYRVNAATREFAGLVLTSDRQARDLVGNTLLQIHHGDGMTCVLNPATAACQLRGAVDDPMVTPDTDDCRPKCLNLSRTDRDIEYVRRQRDALAEIVADPLAPPYRHERERHELARLNTIIDAHEEGRDTR